MAEITVEVNIKDKEVLDKIASLLEQKMKQACVLVQDDAKKSCPVDTGRLQGSITYSVSSGESGAEGVIGTNVEYGPYVEAGTIYQRAQPFLRPAGEKNRDAIVKMFQDLV